MWLTNVSIRRPVFITMVVLALIILGMQARRQMPAELRPKIDFPYITIVTVYPGAGPQEIETLVTKPIEDAVGSTGGLRNVTSTSQDGVSTVVMEFELGTNVDTAAADVRDKMTAARAKLPDDINEPSIGKLDVSALPVMTFALEGKMNGRDKRIVADTMIKDALAKVDGVAAVTANGGDIREVSVSIDRDRLQAYGLTIDQVAQALRAENMNLPSGSIKEGPGGKAIQDYAVRTVGEFTNADEMADVRLKLNGGGGGSDEPAGGVRLGDIATVRDTIQEPSTITRLNGTPSVVLAVQKQSDANTVKVADGVQKQLRLLNGYTQKQRGRETQVKGALPPGVRLVTTLDDSVFVKDSLNDVNKALMQGILLVVLIVFVFLHSGRATTIVALAIPTSLVATYLPMRFFGFSMNMMTLLALSLSVGILVDDSIVVLENIERHLRKGEKPREAALNGRSEIGLAAIAITLVDVVVFVPIAFMGGIVGQFFRQFGLTVAVATLFSLFMSFTLTPMLASRWLRSKEEEEVVEERARTSFFGRLFAGFESRFQALSSWYVGVLRWAIDHRALTIVIGFTTLLCVIGMIGTPILSRPRIAIAMITIVLALATSTARGARRVGVSYAILMSFLVLFLRFPLGVEFFPSLDRGQFAITIKAPAGTGLDSTDRVVRQVESLLKDIPDMEYYQSTVGSTSSGAFGGGDQGPQFARVSVKLKDATERKIKRPIDDVVAELQQETALIPGAEIRVAVDTGMGPTGQPIQMEVTGANMQDIVNVSERVEAKMKQIPGVMDAQSSWDVAKPELRVTVDRLRSADLGVSVAQIASALRTSIEGNTDAKLRDAGEQYDIRVRLAKFDRENVGDVSGTIVGHKEGAPIYLRDVAKVDLANAPVKIDRKNRQRLVTVGANVMRGYSQGNVQTQVEQAMTSIDSGTTRIAVGGMGQMMKESFGYLGSALLLAIALVYMLMGALFESFITPIAIMFSLPQAMIGALLALMLTGNTLSIISMIGIIMLTGLVTKNSILMIDYTNTLRGRGKPRTEAILEAGPTRLRPILMTTFAMIGGMLPTALALSRGSEQRAPMAIAVIGGLILSTMLTLLVIPTVYTVVDDAATRWKRRFSHPARRDDIDVEGWKPPDYGGDGHDGQQEKQPELREPERQREQFDFD